MNVVGRSIPLLTLMLGQSALAAVRPVAAGENIQTAIDAASSGDVIVVAAGTFSECLTISKKIRLIGAGVELGAGRLPFRLDQKLVLPGSALRAISDRDRLDRPRIDFPLRP